MDPNNNQNNPNSTTPQQSVPQPPVQNSTLPVSSVPPSQPVVPASISSTPTQVPPSPSSVPPQVTPPVSSSPVKPPEKHTYLPFLIVLLFIVLLALVYTLINGSFTKRESTAQTTPYPTVIPVATKMPTPTLSPEEELNTIDIGSPESDLIDIKKDVQGL